MKEYIINTDSGIEFGVFGVSENEARETAEDILNTITITSVVENVRPLQYNTGIRNETKGREDGVRPVFVGKEVCF